MKEITCIQTLPIIKNLEIKNLTLIWSKKQKTELSNFEKLTFTSASIKMTIPQQLMIINLKNHLLAKWTRQVLQTECRR